VRGPATRDGAGRAKPFLEPSAQVAENFRLATAVMTDGRVLSGIPGAGTNATVTLRTPTGPLVLVRDEIESLTGSSLSLMPDQLLEPFSADELADLFAYLMTSPPGAASATGE